MADVLTYAGLAVLTDALDGLSWKIGWGTGTGTAARSDTTLSIEASETRVAATLARETISQTNDTLVASGTLTADGNKTITNAGVLTAAAPGGTLVLHSDFTGIPLTTGQAIAFTFKLRCK